MNNFGSTLEGLVNIDINAVALYFVLFPKGLFEVESDRVFKLASYALQVSELLRFSCISLREPLGVQACSLCYI